MGVGMEQVLRDMLAEGLLTEMAAQRASALVAGGKPLDEAVLAADGVSEEKLLRYLAKTFDVPYVELETAGPSKEFVAQFPLRLLVQHQILPLEEKEGVVRVATSRLWETAGVDQLRLACGRDCQLALAPRGEIDRCLKRLLGVGADTLETLVSDSGDIQVIDENEDDLDLSNAAQDASIIKFVNQVLTEAIELRATDVHIEPFENELRVRYRVDGELQNANIPEQVKRFHAAIVSRLKILSNLDIAEKRLPQDGRIKLKIGGQEIDVRVSVIPMMHGEAVVLRLLHRLDALMGTQHLGMSDPRSVVVRQDPGDAARNRAGDRADRQRKDDDAVCGAIEDQ